MQITTGTARGCVDASLGTWTESVGTLAKDGRTIARIRAENIAGGGFDIRPVLVWSDPAGFRAMQAIFGIGRKVDAGVSSLHTIKAWLERHPEAFGAKAEKPYDYIHPDYSPVRGAAIDLRIIRRGKGLVDKDGAIRELKRGWARMFPAPAGKLPA